MSTSKRQKVASGPQLSSTLPSLFQIFSRKLPGSDDDYDMPVFGTWENPIFVAEDVACLCGVSIGAMAHRLGLYNDEIYAFKMKILNPKATGKQRKTQEKWVMTEAGVLRFALGTQGAAGQDYARWVFVEVLPTIRRTGNYTVKSQEELDKMNASLKEKLAETVKSHETAISEMNIAMEKIKEKMSDTATKLKAKEDEIQTLTADSELAKALQVEVEGLQNDANLMQQEYDDVVEDFDVVSEHLNVCVGSSDLTSILSTAVMAPPMVNRNQLILLRCSAFNVLHTIAYMLVRGNIESKARYMTCAEMSNAIHEIMEVEDAAVPEKACKNWISLYCILAKLAKSRLDDEAEYSTEMPLSHIYLYARNINVWVYATFAIENFLSYEGEIRAFYGEAAVSHFQFDVVQYANAIVCQNHRITDFFH